MWPEVNRWLDVPIVLRVYDRALGFAVAERFDFQNVRSTVELAAPWFIGAAMGLQVLGTFSVGQSSFVVGGMHVEPAVNSTGCRCSTCPPEPGSSRSPGQTSRSSCTHAAMPCCEAATPYTSSVLTANCWTRCARDSLPELFGAGAALACRNLATVPAVTGWVAA
ncbi:trkA-N family domain protein [Mycobacterium xenopi 3993]|nr:trkA-N family domain protein [Mycobacterium xenopi 3993]